MPHHFFCVPVENCEALHRDISHLLGRPDINMNVHIKCLFQKIIGLLRISSIIWAQFIGRSLTTWRLPSEQIDVTRFRCSLASSFSSSRLPSWWLSNSVPQHVWWTTITTWDWCQRLEKVRNEDKSGDLPAIVENLDSAAEIFLRHISHSWRSEWLSNSCLWSLLTSVDEHGTPSSPSLLLASHLSNLKPTSPFFATLLKRISGTQKTVPYNLTDTVMDQTFLFWEISRSLSSPGNSTSLLAQ